MFIGPDRDKPMLTFRIRQNRGRTIQRRGFTLLEITLAVAILGMMSLAIFRFVQSNLAALRVSADASVADAQYNGLRDLLAAEWQSLTPIRGKMTGEPFKLNDRERDEIKWNCSAGPGLLTRYAPDDFTVWLRLRRENDSVNQLDLGLLDRKSTRLNSSHTVISYAVFCLKKKKHKKQKPNCRDT